MKKLIVAVVAAMCAVGVAAPASAQYPDRPIKMIVPWAAGGDTDNIFRPLAPLLQKHLGQTVVIANVGGASGTVGAREAKGSPADGYTVYAVHDYIHLVHYAGLTDITYKDFEPICLVAATPSVLTASPKTTWADWKGLVEDAKKRPGEISVGATLGSTSHIFPASVEKAAGIKFKYVSYDGLAPRMNAILGGHVDLTDSNLTQKGKVEAGQLKFIAIASEQRDPDMPNVPTLQGTRHEHRLRGGARPDGAEGHAGAGARQAGGGLPEGHLGRRVPGCHEEAGHPRRLPGRQGLCRLPRQDRCREQGDHDRPRADQEMRLGRDGIAGLIGLAVSLLLLPHALGLPKLPIVPVGPGFYPTIVLVFMALTSALLLLQDVRAQRQPVAASADATPAVPRAYGLVAAAFAAVAVYIALLPLIGFRLATVLFVAAFQVILELPRTLLEWLQMAAIAVGTSAVTYTVFNNYLLVLLPRGTWTGW